VLMHAVLRQTVQALPDILDYIQQNGFQLMMVKDVVKAKYGGMSSDELVPDDHTGGSMAGVPGCKPTGTGGGTGGTGGAGGGGTGGNGGAGGGGNGGAGGGGNGGAGGAGTGNGSGSSGGCAVTSSQGHSLGPIVLALAAVAGFARRRRWHRRR